MPNKKLNKLINSFSSYKEDIFLSSMNKIIKDQADINNSLKIFSEIFQDQEVSLHLKFLLIKFIGVNKNNCYTKSLALLNNKNEKFRIKKEAVQALIKIETIESYKEILNFYYEEKENKEIIKQYLLSLLKNNSLIRAFHLFYMGWKEDENNIKKAKLILIKRLADKNILDLLPIVEDYPKKSHLYLPLLDILIHSPSSIYVPALFRSFKKNYLNWDLKTFNKSINALTLSLYEIEAEPIKKELWNMAGLLKKEKRQFLMIYLIRLDTTKALSKINEDLQSLQRESKQLLIEILNEKDIDCHKTISIWLEKEEISTFFKPLIELLIKYENPIEIFQNSLKFHTNKSKQILLAMVELKIQGFKDIVFDFLKGEKNINILKEYFIYLIKTEEEQDPQILFNIALSSSYPEELMDIIVKNMIVFPSSSIVPLIRKLAEENYFIKNIKTMLVVLEKILRKNHYRDINFPTWILDKVLVVFEENPENDILPFINFLSKFPIENRTQGILIIEELRLMLNYMLENMDNHDDIVLIHKEIKKIKQKIKILESH